MYRLFNLMGYRLGNATIRLLVETPELVNLAYQGGFETGPLAPSNKKAA